MTDHGWSDGTGADRGAVCMPMHMSLRKGDRLVRNTAVELEVAAIDPAGGSGTKPNNIFASATCDTIVTDNVVLAVYLLTFGFDNSHVDCMYRLDACGSMSICIGGNLIRN